MRHSHRRDLSRDFTSIFDKQRRRKKRSCSWNCPFQFDSRQKVKRQGSMRIDKQWKREKDPYKKWNKPRRLRRDGYSPADCNGVWNDPEIPILWRGSRPAFPTPERHKKAINKDQFIRTFPLLLALTGFFRIFQDCWNGSNILDDSFDVFQHFFFVGVVCHLKRFFFLGGGRGEMLGGSCRIFSMQDLFWYSSRSFEMERGSRRASEIVTAAKQMSSCRWVTSLRRGAWPRVVIDQWQPAPLSAVDRWVMSIDFFGKLS